MHMEHLAVESPVQEISDNLEDQELQHLEVDSLVALANLQKGLVVSDQEEVEICGVQ